MRGPATEIHTRSRYVMIISRHSSPSTRVRYLVGCRGITNWNLVVIFRRLLELRARQRIMLDPELRFCILNECFDRLAALCGLLLVEVETRNNLQFQFFGIVIEIARQKNGSGFGKLQEQRLMSRRMARCEFDHHGAVTEHVVVLAVE